MSSTSSHEVKAAKIGAVSTRMAALITAVGVLVAAACSVLAAVVSANIAANSTRETTTIQLAGETDRSRAEFLRTQRQVLYSQVLEHLQDISSTEENFAHAVSDLDPAEAQAQARAGYQEVIASDSREGLFGVEAARTQLIQDNYSMSIIGSSEAHNALSELIDLHLEQKKALGKLAEERAQEPHFITKKSWVAYDNIGKAEVAKAEARFAAAARADMGAD